MSVLTLESPLRAGTGLYRASSTKLTSEPAYLEKHVAKKWVLIHVLLLLSLGQKPACKNNDPSSSLLLSLFLFRNEKVKAEMQGWGLAFSQTLMTLNARVAPQENIYQKNNAQVRLVL